jgi:hypothetical protein
MKKATYMPILLVGALSLINFAHAEMYKWTDKSGETHYTETPPPADTKGKDIEADIKLSSGTPSSAGSTAKTEEKESDKKAEPAEPSEAAKKSEEEHRQFCTHQQDALKLLSENSLVNWKDEKGTHVLTAAEKAIKTQEINKNLATLCTPEMFSSKNAATQPPADAKTTTDSKDQAADKTATETSGQAH